MTFYDMFVTGTIVFVVTLIAGYVFELLHIDNWFSKFYRIFF